MPATKVSPRELALEAGLRLFGRIPRMNHERRQVVSQYLLDLTKELSGLSKNDLVILEAVIKSGSIREASELLAPGRPGYRSYVQRRFKHFERLIEKTTKMASFLRRASPGN